MKRQRLYIQVLFESFHTMNLYETFTSGKFNIFDCAMIILIEEQFLNFVSSDKNVSKMSKLKKNMSKMVYS